MRPRLLAVLLAAFLAAPRLARANMAKAILDGERYGTIVPDGATAVRVDREDLAFVLRRGLASAVVTASYQLTNTGAVVEAADVAFAFVRGERDEDDPGARASVDADGAPLPFRAVTDAELIEPKLRAWLDEHPAVVQELSAPGDRRDPAPLRAAVADAGGRCRDDCGRLVAWYGSSLSGDEARRLPARAEDEALLDAAREVIPAAAAELSRKWSTFSGRNQDARLGFLLFHLDFQPGQTRALAVHYEHRAEEDRRAHVNSTYGFDYLLSPARRWAGFGPLDISVRVPGDATFTSPLPFQRDGDTYRARLPGLPDGELRFEAMSRDGLWLGMTEPGGYWAIVVAAMGAAAIAVGAAAGRVWAGASRWKRVLLPILTAGPLAAVCSLAVLVLLLAAFPHHALGFGYGGIIGGGLLVVLALPAGALASAVSAARKARKAPPAGADSAK